ncbi:hypothetical protein T459_08881 [Capsicum annuum]|uniref:BEACH-type PH domain-containing protein n=1 Tax=Capsicum annuum TaxID=4072 RepID=A0A2G2ZXT6_CAPAN|nr:hypothetical protein T459_08881 [Capsicum annuum]
MVGCYIQTVSVRIIYNNLSMSGESNHWPSPLTMKNLSGSSAPLKLGRLELPKERTENETNASDGSSRQSSSLKADETRTMEDNLEKKLGDNGEYLIRPYLEPSERIKYKYNYKRVVGLDRHDGIFLIGELSLYIIENFYIDDSGCICKKGCEDDLSIIDQALGGKKDFSCSMDSHSKSSSS